MNNAYALVTGASKGIGKEFSHLLAKRGYNLILVARDHLCLELLADALSESYAIHTIIYPIDLSTEHTAIELFQYISKLGIIPELLVNNAGFYSSGSFHSNDWTKEKAILQLSIYTPTELIKLFLPLMLKNKKGYILNVASNGAFVPGPYNAVYCASKAYILSFTEALAEELKHTRVHASVLCPGGTNTSFQNLDLRKKSWLFPLLEPSFVAATGLKGVFARRRVIVPGFLYKVQYHFLRFIPRMLLIRMAAKMAKPAAKSYSMQPSKLKTETT